MDSAGACCDAGNVTSLTGKPPLADRDADDKA